MKYVPFNSATNETVQKSVSKCYKDLGRQFCLAKVIHFLFIYVQNILSKSKVFMSSQAWQVSLMSCQNKKKDKIRFHLWLKWIIFFDKKNVICSALKAGDIPHENKVCMGGKDQYWRWHFLVHKRFSFSEKLFYHPCCFICF